jgi:hypothetical protein
MLEKFRCNNQATCLPQSAAARSARVDLVIHHVSVSTTSGWIAALIDLWPTSPVALKADARR